MSYEWHVVYRLELESWKDMEEQAREKLSQPGAPPKDSAVRKQVEQRAKEKLWGVVQLVSDLDLYAGLHLLAQTVGDGDSKGRWNTAAKGVYSELVLSPAYTNYIKDQKDRFSSSGFDTPRLDEKDLAKLHENSFFLYVPFTLAAPYVSKDDEPFYVHENPLHKDWVLRIPTVSSTSWKGSFRAALRWRLQAEDNDPRLVRLLGNPKGEEKNFRRGRLSFFPTFFDGLEVGVINPHSRQRGAGTQPIDIEQVPRSAHGVFALLYTPTIPSGPEEPLPGWDEVLEDIDLVGKAVYALLVELGFGAKTSSGMGRAEEDITGAYLLVHRGIETSPKLPPPPAGVPPPHVFQPDTLEFLDESGNWPYYATDEELEKRIPGSAARSRYKKQRLAYRDWRKARDQWEAWKQEIAALRSQVQRRMLRLAPDELKTMRDLQQLRELLAAKIGADTKGGRDG